MDARDPLVNSVAYLPSADHDAGIRSVVIRENLLAMAGGAGRISFFDLRAGRFVPTRESQRGACGGGGHRFFVFLFFCV
jgi:hypothetical protein